MADITERYITPQIKQLGRLLRRLLSRRRPAAKPEELVTNVQTMLIHANSRSKTFHLPDCEQYDCESCTIEFNSVQVAQEAGFVPCRFCKTLIEKNEQ